MKPLWCLMIILCTYGASAVGQGVVAVPSFANRQAVLQDNVLVLSTLGKPYYFATIQDSVLVTSDFPLPLLIADSTTTISGPDRIAGLKVFPNPVPDILVIQRENQNEDYRVEIYSSGGTLMQAYNWKRGINTYQPSLKNCASGTYVLIITNSANTEKSCYKIIKP